jgi:hypothetical protein
MSELLFGIDKVSHGGLGCSWRPQSFVESTVLLPHDLGPKDFYFGRDKSDLRGMT